jgi:3-methyladenine DNA glycosylase AlkD
MAVNLVSSRQFIQRCASPQKAKILQSFFKTGKGQYGEGDIFIGVIVPDIRKAAQRFRGLGEKDILTLLHSRIHEERMLALLIWVIQYEKNKEDTKRKIFDLYLKNTRWVNNWDLVDLSAPRIVGDFLLNQDKKLLCELAGSDSLWERRIAIVATFAFIRAGRLDVTPKIAGMLLKDKEDLIHKACGWMLREVGKREPQALTGFLEKYCRVMPRTMLRYSIERLSKSARRNYMAPQNPIHKWRKK